MVNPSQSLPFHCLIWRWVSVFLPSSILCFSFTPNKFTTQFKRLPNFNAASMHPFIFYWLNIPNSFHNSSRTWHTGTVLTSPINMNYKVNQLYNVHHCGLMKQLFIMGFFLVVVVYICYSLLLCLLFTLDVISWSIWISVPLPFSHL